MFNFLMQNSQILIILFVILGPIIGKVAGWLVEQKKKRDQLLLRRQREEEELRTGRVSEPEPTGPTPEQLEQMMIAEQMRLQHEEMLRQRAAQAEARRQAAQRRAEAARKQKDRSTGSTDTDVLVPPRGAQTQPVGAAGVSSATPSRTAPLQKMTRLTPTGTKSLPAAALVGSLDRDSMRRAIVLTEILGPPIALRDQHIG